MKRCTGRMAFELEVKLEGPFALLMLAVFRPMVSGREVEAGGIAQ